MDGEVRFDAGSRAAYAHDASNYRQVPIGVVIPRTVDAAVEAVAVCHRHDVAVFSRGGGTSLAGQCCNSCGASAQAYGKMGDWVARLEVLTYDGTRMWATNPSGRWQRTPDDPRLDGALLLPAIRGAVPAGDPRSRPRCAGSSATAPPAARRACCPRSTT